MDEIVEVGQVFGVSWSSYWISPAQVVDRTHDPVVDEKNNTNRHLDLQRGCPVWRSRMVVGWGFHL